MSNAQNVALTTHTGAVGLDAAEGEDPLLMPIRETRGFDFGLVGDITIREQLIQETLLIRATTTHAFMIVGRCLARIKELLEGTGLFKDFVQAEFGFTWRTASRYINGYLMLSAHHVTPEHLDSSRIGKSTVHMLSSPSAPKEVVGAIMEKIRAGQHVTLTEVSAALAGAEETHQEEMDALRDETRDLAREVEREKARADHLELEAVKKREQLDRAANRLEVAHSEIGEMEASIEQLRRQLDDARRKADNEVTVAVETREVQVLPPECQNIHEAIEQLESEKQQAARQLEDIHADLEAKKAEMELIDAQLKSAAITLAHVSDLESRIASILGDYSGPVIEEIRRLDGARERLLAIAQRLTSFAEAIQDNPA